MNLPADAYVGDEPYIFVSYSHRDAAIVYRAIERLCAAYFRIWYDEGIDPGSVWREVLDRKVMRSRCVVAFLSKSALASEHVINELRSAQSHQKQTFPVYMEHVGLAEPVREFISSFQAISIEDAEASGRWTGLAEALPAETRQFQSAEQQLRFLEKGLLNPLVAKLLQDHARDELGWCSVQRRASPYDDFLQTCRLCGESDWFEAKRLGSPGPVEQCPRCGLSQDPGRAKPWFNDIRKDGENISVRCTTCHNHTTYAFDDGPPFLCPTCGRHTYG